MVSGTQCTSRSRAAVGCQPAPHVYLPPHLEGVIRAPDRQFACAGCDSSIAGLAGPLLLIARGGMRSADPEEGQMVVRDVMTEDPFTIEPDAPLDRASDVMRAKGLRRLPVV